MTDQIYHVVDGKVVPKPGNQRDSNRRYKNSNGKTIEFTPEEETARDAEEAKWESEKPLREAEAKKQKEEAEKFRESLCYKNKLVAFIDVLGWRQGIKNSEHNPELVKKLGLSLQTLVTQEKMAKWQQEHEFPCDFRISQFSDCFVLSIEPNHIGKSQLISSLDWTISHFLANGFLTRGAIVQGDIYHEGGMVYGPALVSAYDLEQKADFPRVILQSELAVYWGKGDRYLNKDGSLLGFSKTWRKDEDEDGEVFLDYLQPFLANTFDPPNVSFLKASLKPVYKLVTETLSKKNLDDKIRKKHTWLAKYYNSILDEYPDVGMNKI
jgi:hypothetical protein